MEGDWKDHWFGNQSCGRLAGLEGDVDSQVSLPHLVSSNREGRECNLTIDSNMLTMVDVAEVVWVSTRNCPGLS